MTYIDAMKQALDVMVVLSYSNSATDEVCINLRKAIEEAEKAIDIGSEWTPCVKLPVVVHVRNQREGETHISTREGLTPVLPDDLIMRGVEGEEYPIGREIFNRTYTFDTTPQREWVGLTDAEIDEGQKHSWVAQQAFESAVWWAEEKLKEKNS
jgi:hypothetical protein